MLKFALFALLASRVYQMCGHFHYFCNAPIKRGFQKTRIGHVVFTVYDGLTFVADVLLMSANVIFVSLAVGHLAVAGLQVLAWNIYCERFFDIVFARSYYSDGSYVLRRIVLLAYDLVGQGLSMILLVSSLELGLVLPALAVGIVSYVWFTADVRLLWAARSHS